MRIRENNPSDRVSRAKRRDVSRPDGDEDQGNQPVRPSVTSEAKGCSEG
jgi:hypothetical protein